MPLMLFTGVICNCVSLWVLLDHELRRAPIYTFLAFLSACDVVNTLSLGIFAVFESHLPGIISSYWNISALPVSSTTNAWSLVLTVALTADRYIHIGRSRTVKARAVIIDRSRGAHRRNHCHWNRAHLISLLLLILSMVINCPRWFVYYYDDARGCVASRQFALEKNGWFHWVSVARFILLKGGKLNSFE